jgi:hypothetical protein
VGTGADDVTDAEFTKLGGYFVDDGHLQFIHDADNVRYVALVDDAWMLDDLVTLALADDGMPCVCGWCKS